MGEQYRENFKRAANRLPPTNLSQDDTDIVRFQDLDSVSVNASGLQGQAVSSGVPSSGNTLVFVSGQWIPGTASVRVLDEGSDVALATFDTLDFIGDGVNVVDGGDSGFGNRKANVNIGGGFNQTAFAQLSWNGESGAKSTAGFAFDPVYAQTYGVVVDDGIVGNKMGIFAGVVVDAGGTPIARSVAWSNDNSGDANRDAANINDPTGESAAVGGYIYQRGDNGAPGGFVLGDNLTAHGFEMQVTSFDSSGIEITPTASGTITASMHFFIVG